MRAPANAILDLDSAHMEIIGLKKNTLKDVRFLFGAKRILLNAWDTGIDSP